MQRIPSSDHLVKRLRGCVAISVAWYFSLRDPPHVVAFRSEEVALVLPFWARSCRPTICQCASPDALVCGVLCR